MGTKRKAENASEALKGKAKETVGKAVGDRRMTAEGKAQQSMAAARQAMEKIKDAARH
ncbi:CsbD family protein [Kitasatospora sp. NPDC001660]